MQGYNSNGRPIYRITQDGPWTGNSFTLKPPNGNVRSQLDAYDVLSQPQTEGIRPRIDINGSGKAKRFFKRETSHMPLPEGA
jgi:hypothetical protein